MGLWGNIMLPSIYVCVCVPLCLCVRLYLFVHTCKYQLYCIVMPMRQALHNAAMHKDDGTNIN